MIYLKASNTSRIVPVHNSYDMNDQKYEYLDGVLSLCH